MSAPPPHTHISTGRTNSELNRVTPGSTSATSGATNTSVSAGKARFQTEATAPSAVDMSTPQQRTRPGSYSCRISGYSRMTLPYALSPYRALPKEACPVCNGVSPTHPDQEASHGAFYAAGPSRPAPVPAPALPARRRPALQRRPPRPTRPRRPRGRGRHLPRPRLHPGGDAVGLPLPGRQQGPLLPHRRRPPQRLPRRPPPAALLGPHRQLLQGPAAPTRGRPGPAGPRHRPRPAAAVPGRLAVARPAGEDRRRLVGVHAG